MGFFDTDCCVTYNRHAGKARANVDVTFCQSNPSALLALLMAWGWAAFTSLVFNQGETKTGRAHDGHSEHQFVLSDTEKQGPAQLELLRCLDEGLIVKRRQAGLALEFLAVKEAAKEAGRSVAATNAKLEPIIAALAAANGYGPEVWLPRHENLAVDRLQAMSGEDLLDWFCGACAGNGGSYLTSKTRWDRCVPEFVLKWGRDAPGLLVLVWRRLGFGSLCGESGCACPGVPGGWYSRLVFSTPSDLDKLLAVFVGSKVTLADGTVVPATASGRPRLYMKLLKFITLLAYAHKHRKPRRPTCGKPPGKYTMAFADAAGQRGWWTDAKQWRYMCAALWPGLAIPDHEH